MHKQKQISTVTSSGELSLRRGKGDAQEMVSKRKQTEEFVDQNSENRKIEHLGNPKVQNLHKSSTNSDCDDSESLSDSESLTDSESLSEIALLEEVNAAFVGFV